MSTCEICWTNASHKALMGMGFTADLYRAELDAHPEHATPAPVETQEKGDQ